MGFCNHFNRNLEIIEKLIEVGKDNFKRTEKTNNELDKLLETKRKATQRINPQAALFIKLSIVNIQKSLRIFCFLIHIFEQKL